MAGKAEIERERSQDSQNPLRSHSMNQYNLGISFAGEQRIRIPRKVIMAERRRQRSAENRQPGEDNSAIEVTGTAESLHDPVSFAAERRFRQRYGV